LPAVALSAFLLLYPFLDSARVSLLEWTGIGEGTYVGFDNYAELLGDPNAGLALRNTIVFAFANAILSVGIGLAFALAINRRMPGAESFKFLLFVPILLPTVFFSLVWAYALDGNFGWFNDILGWIHPSLPRGWVGDPSWVLPTITLISVLQFTGFPMIILLAALEDVPRDVHEAATLDGVTELQRVRYISIPSIRDVIATIFLLQLMFGFRVFDQVFVMSRGGPGRVSEVAATFVYREAFLNRRFGYATAEAIVIAIVIAVISMIYVTIIRPRRAERAG
jgi:ABC-type sugar transport system permease subunit